MCFAWSSLLYFLVWLVVICAFVAIIRVLISFAAGTLGSPFSDIAGVVLQILWIILWTLVIIAVILFCNELFSCLWQSVSFPRLR